MAYVLRGTSDIEQMSQVMREISEASDRAAAIVAGSLLETSLTEALVAHLHKNEKVTNELFKMAGAIGSFSAKIDVGFLVGLYSSSTHAEFVTVKNIRNSFAHKIEKGSFKEQQISAWCSNLKLCERHSIDQKVFESSYIKSTGTQEWRDRKLWIIEPGLVSTLNDPRKRYILNIQVMMYGLILADTTQMPAGYF